MYDDKENRDPSNFANIPATMRNIGITQADRDKVMELLMDVSGTSVHIDEAIRLYEKLGIKGFAFVKRHQVEKLLKDQGVPQEEMDLEDLNIYDNMTDAQMEEALWRTVEYIATNKTYMLEPNEHARRKRNWISVGPAIVLSPYMFTWGFGAVLLGPVILSPNIFCPPVLNPSILSPWVLTPSMFNPFILSPYILGPFVLGPFAFTSFVLTPYLLSSNIMNPAIFTSLILSPLGLCADILSPVAVAANVLSPSFLSPPVLNPTTLTASVLSPSWLS
uniref:EF-hand domain-containing protein n=1 Tax=Panagrellus redivivus TaxID=6233 RepID=A0A7E4VXN3_PANRE